jgi:hypothetical protein
MICVEKRWDAASPRRAETNNPFKSLKISGVFEKNQSQSRAMSDIHLHIRNKEDGKEHVIDTPADLRVVDFLSELIDGLQLPAGAWVLDDQETGMRLDPQVTLSTNRVLSGHHLRLHRNGVEPELPPSKHQTLPLPPDKDGLDERAKEKDIEKAPVKPPVEPDEIEWPWVLGSLAVVLVIGLLVAGVYRWMHRVTVTLTPAQVEVAAGDSAKFSAVIKGNPNHAIRWSLNPRLGSIGEDGTYRAPLTAEQGQKVTITATSAADPSKSANARVTLRAVLHVSVSPTEATAIASQKIQFTASVTGSSNEAVRWSISPEVGNISTDGSYSAPPSITSPSTVMVTATSQGNPGLSASATVILTPPAAPVVTSVQVSPSHAALSHNGQMIFQAKVNGTSNQRVVWSASTGTIAQSGAYTAPASIEPGQTAVITAKSVADPRKVGRAMIDLRAEVDIRVTPTQITLGVSHGQQQFTSSVSGTTNGGVRWSATGGTISPSGLFTAPPATKAAQTVRITASSEADPTKQAFASVTVEPLPAKTEEHNGPVTQDSGLILWSGALEGGQTLTINGSQASTGSVLSGKLPGIPVVLNVTPLELVGIQEAPGPSNGWARLVLRSRKKMHAVVSIEWKAIR